MGMPFGAETQRILDAKAGSIINFEFATQKRQGESWDEFVTRVHMYRTSAKRNGVVTVAHPDPKGKLVGVEMLNDYNTKASPAELEALANKREPTLREWAKKRAKVPPPPTADKVLVQILQPQDHHKAASRGARIASEHAEVGYIPEPKATNGHAQPHPAPEPEATQAQVHVHTDEVRQEEMRLYRETYVSNLRANPMGAEDARAATAGAAVEAFRKFFGI